MGKTVFFGGTFNPPHIAHKLMLKAVADIESVDKILVVPTNIPPHKVINGFCASGEDRLNMCRLLSKGVSKAVVSDMELVRGGKSYSFDTLTALKKEYNELCIVIGGDMITTFDTWYRYKDILKIAEVLAVRRPGIDDELFDSYVGLMRKLGGTVEVIEAKMPDISSSEIRDCIERSEPFALSKYLPPEICDYITNNKLYR